MKRPLAIISLILSVAGAGSAGATEFKISAPQDASLIIGLKTRHFVDITPIAPTGKVTQEGTTVYTYDLELGKVYDYRTWRSGGITNAGYFTMSTDESRRPKVAFTAEDYEGNPKAFNEDPSANKGYETGDILLNINPQGHLQMKPGESFNLHAMRNWELTDNISNNHFFEPEFHYSILSETGEPSSEVIEIEGDATSAWATLKAKEEGTAIVLVTYDTLKVNYYSSGEKREYLGGESWGAIWPENTGVFVVTVGETAISTPDFTINEEYNVGSTKKSGRFVDAEHDIFYFLEGEAGYVYTFKPAGVEKIEIAYPKLIDGVVGYEGFTTAGVTMKTDGSCDILLKSGRQILRLTDARGLTAYQVLTARPCRLEISNETHPGRDVFRPGEKVKLQYSGLYHPAGKLAGVYNLTASIFYHDAPQGVEMSSGSSQYTFASSPGAQAVMLEIPSDYDHTANPVLRLSGGTLQVSGYGDPVGSHRHIVKGEGRAPNFNANSGSTFLGRLPDFELPISEPAGIGSYSIDSEEFDPYPTDEPFLIIDLSGRIIRRDVTAEALQGLAPGIYVTRSARGVKKVCVR